MLAMKFIFVLGSEGLGSGETGSRSCGHDTQNTS